MAEAAEAIGRGAAALQLFAYPSSRHFPWGTVAMLVASGGLTAATALCWHLGICRAQTVDELRPLLLAFTKGVSSCAVSSDQVLQGEVHRLFTASLLRAGERPSRALADTAVLACCGTLLERLHGPSFMLAFTIGATALSNALAAAAHSALVSVRVAPGACADQAYNGSAASITSTSGGIVALGTLCAIRYGRWAAWRGLPLPISWVLAPVVVADVSAAREYFRQLREFKAVVVSPKAPTEGDALEGGDPELVDPEEAPSGFELAVALAACQAADAHARSECRPPPDDIALWRDDLERAAEVATPLPPDGAFLGDIAGALLAVVVAVAARGRFQLRPYGGTLGRQ